MAAPIGCRGNIRGGTIMKKTCKRLLVSLMAAATLFSLAACSGGSNQPASTGTPASTSPDGATLDFPKQDITLIVPYAAGGTTDLLARALTTQLSDDLGVNVIVQNVEGGGGTTGTSQAVNSKADGYTLAICSNGGYLINPAINEVGYTWETTTPICIVSEIPIALGVAASSPYETLQDLIDAAAAAPGSVTYVSPGANSTPHLLVAAVGQQAGVQWNHSPNSSSPAAIAELIGGHIDAVSVNLPTFKSSTNDGSVRLLAVTGDERDPSYPDVPTFKELGYDFPASVYFCIVGPADIDPAVAQRLSDAVGTAMENADVQDSFTKLDFPMSFTSSEDFAARIPEDFALYEGILKDLGILS